MMRKLLLRVVLITVLQLARTSDSKIPLHNTAMWNDSFNMQVMKSSTKECRLFPATDAVISLEELAFKSGAKLIQFQFNIRHLDEQVLSLRSNLYQPMFWVRATMRQGSRLLLLPPAYDVLSLYTMKLDVETIHVDVIQHPEQCLYQFPDTSVEEFIRRMIMSGFRNDTTLQDGSARMSDSVCNMHILNDTGFAKFSYRCCKNSVKEGVVCHYLQPDIPMQILFLLIFVFKIAMVLYTPRFVPDSIYRIKNVTRTFIHKLEDKLTLKTIVTEDSTKYHKVSVLKIYKRERFCTMSNFNATLGSLKPDVIYSLSVSELELKVAHRHLLHESYAPVGVLNVLNDMFFSCKIRHRKSVRNCCVAPFCKCIKQLSCRWHVVLKFLMRLVLVALLFIPWLLRLYVYYNFEEEPFTARKDAANLRSLHIYYPGNLIVYLSPFHTIFITAYAILGFDLSLYIYLTTSNQRYNDVFKVVIRKCFNDMREASLRKNVGWVVKHVLRPCRKCGIAGLCFGLMLFPFSFTLSVLYLVFQAIPTVNIILRLSAHVIVFLFSTKCFGAIPGLGWFAKMLKEAESTLEMDIYSTGRKIEVIDKWKIMNTCLKRFLQIIIVFMLLASFSAVLLIFFELVSFGVDLFVFTLIGLILNASKLMSYFSIIFLLIIYVNDCFGSVREKFLTFNRTLNGVLLSLVKDKVLNTICRRREHDQCNEAYRIRVNIGDEFDETNVDKVKDRVTLAKTIKGEPRWRIPQLALFLSSEDEPMIPKHLFLKSCLMPYYNAPGDLLMCYVRAVAEFIIISLFLIFVFVVVLTFGETYKVSATNQMLATAAGGIVPFMLKNLLFRSRVSSSIDTDSVHFQYNLAELVNNYIRLWVISDITVDKVSVPGLSKNQPSSRNDLDLTDKRNKRHRVSVENEIEDSTNVDDTDTHSIDDTDAQSDVSGEEMLPLKVIQSNNRNQSNDCTDIDLIVYI